MLDDVEILLREESKTYKNTTEFSMLGNENQYKNFWIKHYFKVKRKNISFYRCIFQAMINLNVNNQKIH